MSDVSRIWQYYANELAYLRQEGQRFAQRYPGVATGLKLDRDVSPDPHVERLLESFAFLTGRIQQRIDDQVPEVSASLLDVLCPHWMAPVPSMAIVSFDPDVENPSVLSGVEIQEGLELYAESLDGVRCRFRTTAPLTVWPLEVTEAELLPRSELDFSAARFGNAVAGALRVRLSSGGAPLSKMLPDSLRFHLHGEPRVANRLYELLLSSTVAATLRTSDGQLHAIPWRENETISAGGFEDREAALPTPHPVLRAYRLLQEYFSFPDKFRFVSVRRLRRAWPDESAAGGAGPIDLYFMLDRTPERSLKLGRDAFKLNCTPVVNLFSRTSEPLRLDHSRTEYRLIPDLHRERTTEIYSIQRVLATSKNEGRAKEYKPFFSYSHAMRQSEHPAYWSYYRKPALLPDSEGSDVFLRFLDLDYRPKTAPDEVAYAEILCTNRGWARHIRPGAELFTETSLPVTRTTALSRPSRQLTPPSDGETLWRLVSALSLNHLSLALSGGEEIDCLTQDLDAEPALGVTQPTEALREILRLHSFTGSQTDEQQLSGIVAVSAHGATRRIRRGARFGLAYGLEVHMVQDDELYTEREGFLMASVLSRFFGLYASMNSFTQLVVRGVGEKGDRKRWPPMVGDRLFL